MPVKLNSTGGGSVTLDVGSTASNFNLTLPSATGSAVIQDASNNLLMNSGYGSNAVAYGCRAWVNFNGQGTVAIRASGNVSSITDNGTGDYTVNFTTSMPDTNYTAVMQSTLKNVVYGVTAFCGLSGVGTSDPFATNRFRFMTMTPAEQLQDNPFICVSVFR